MAAARGEVHVDAGVLPRAHLHAVVRRALRVVRERRAHVVARSKAIVDRPEIEAREIDRVLLPAVLEFTDANQFQAAKILGLSRQTLRQRLRNIGRNVVKSFDEQSV